MCGVSPDLGILGTIYSIPKGLPPCLGLSNFIVALAQVDLINLIWLHFHPTTLLTYSSTQPTTCCPVPQFIKYVTFQVILPWVALGILFGRTVFGCTQHGNPPFVLPFVGLTAQWSYRLPANLSTRVRVLPTAGSLCTPCVCSRHVMRCPSS